LCDLLFSLIVIAPLVVIAMLGDLLHHRAAGMPKRAIAITRVISRQVKAMPVRRSACHQNMSCWSPPSHSKLLRESRRGAWQREENA
jgi:hypothetical protein